MYLPVWHRDDLNVVDGVSEIFLQRYRNMRKEETTKLSYVLRFVCSLFLLIVSRNVDMVHCIIKRAGPSTSRDFLHHP